MPSLNPYVSFRDNAREAMEFYQSVLGGELDVMTFENVEMEHDPAENHLIMHAHLSTPDGFILMASDTPSSMEYSAPAGFSVSLSGDDDVKLRGYWDGLAEGATITMPLSVPEWGGHFGMLVDKFGVPWMVSISPSE